MGLTLACRDRTTLEPAAVEVKEDVPLGVRPGHEGQALAHARPDAELPGELACEAGLERLARLTLAARELPETAEILGRVPSGDEKAAASLDDGGRHLHDREARASRQLAEERQE